MKHPYRRAAAVLVTIFMLFVIYQQFMVGGFKHFQLLSFNVTKDSPKTTIPNGFFDETSTWNLGPNNTSNDKSIQLVSLDIISLGEIYSKNIMDSSGKEIIGTALVLKTQLKSKPSSPVIEFAFQFVPAGSTFSTSKAMIKGLIRNMVSKGNATIDINSLLTKSDDYTLPDYQKIFTKGSAWRLFPSQDNYHRFLESYNYYKDAKIQIYDDYLIDNNLDFKQSAYLNYMNGKTPMINPIIVVDVRDNQD